MNIEERKEILCQNLKLLNKSIYWLKRSIQRVKNVRNFENLSEEQLEIIEALMNRYSRAVDILINRVLRSLDYLELEEINRKLDVVIRAEKRGFVEDYNILIEMKDLRNELAHEYLEERLRNRLEEVIEKSEKLLEIANKINRYVQKSNYCE
ncbi:hypothetical protein [Desulfurobacterium atlanticum]|uniref:Nucleotidyltransferase substrate binding protein, HI0074 family n=1 Tax=Desulfurobacterium atlanticum TaxID=240169 RepID=A0A238XQW8_9BACT|nr:hypothetical protein [Desulfurobacterium atlanticum]SNR60968.1 hypothetical protein SAMN06265340_101164 [Desulfurobacterium atlanticum]